MLKYKARSTHKGNNKKKRKKTCQTRKEIVKKKQKTEHKTENGIIRTIRNNKEHTRANRAHFQNNGI